MDHDERRVLANQPDTFTIYRGTEAPDGLGAGFSWTLSRERAVWFARRFDKGEPTLITATVGRARVIAYLAGRGEEEIVVLPEHVTITAKEGV